MKKAFNSAFNLRLQFDLTRDKWCIKHFPERKEPNAMAVIFNQSVKHGRVQFLPGVAVAFEDADAEPYFIAAGWADETKDEPVHTYGLGEVDADPLTRFGETGKFVQPELAQAHLDAHDGEAALPAHETAFQSGLIAPAQEA